MWSKNPSPVAISAVPLPSRLSVSSIFVSEVIRETVAVRDMKSSLCREGNGAVSEMSVRGGWACPKETVR